MLALMLLNMTLNSCATASQLPLLKNRSLEICKEHDGFCYGYYQCVQKFLGACIKKEYRTDKYLFSDKAQMQQFREMGFFLKVREKP